jgi:hypothetical protein
MGQRERTADCGNTRPSARQRVSAQRIRVPSTQLCEVQVIIATAAHGGARSSHAAAAAALMGQKKTPARTPPATQPGHRPQARSEKPPTPRAQRPGCGLGARLRGSSTRCTLSTCTHDRGRWRWSAPSAKHRVYAWPSGYGREQVLKLNRKAITRLPSHMSCTVQPNSFDCGYQQSKLIRSQISWPTKAAR